MSELAAFQQRFAAALLAEQPIDRLSERRGFTVYRNTAARGTVEALRGIYPTVAMLVGEDMFGQVALDYRADHPLADPVLSTYGAGFADFLAAQPWSCELPYLADVARLDRLWLEAFLAADPPTSPASHPSGDSPIALHPTARFAWLSTPALTIWQAHRDPGGPSDLAPDWREEGALFVRRGHAIHAEAIGADYHCLLSACRASVRLADCIATVGAAFPDADIVDLVERGVASGALIHL